VNKLTEFLKSHEQYYRPQHWFDDCESAYIFFNTKLNILREAEQYGEPGLIVCPDYTTAFNFLLPEETDWIILNVKRQQLDKLIKLYYKQWVCFCDGTDLLFHTRLLSSTN